MKTFRALLRSPSALFGLAVAAISLVTAVFAPIFAPHAFADDRAACLARKRGARRFASVARRLISSAATSSPG